MALDPALIAALSAGAKTTNSSQDWDSWKSGYGERGGAWNLGQSIIDVLSTGGYATAGLTYKIGENLAALQRGELGAAADLVNPFSGISAMVKGVSDRRTYSENLRAMGMDDTAATWLGLALDIGLDPTTYITGGTLAGAKGAAQGARLAAEATKAGKVAGATAPSLVPATRLAGAKRVPTAPFEPVGRELTQGEKLGNLLSGISRGYETGKNQYKLSVKQNKLQRVSAKQAKKAELVRGEVGVDSSFSNVPRGTSTAAVITEKEAKAAAKVAKAKAKVDASKLPGVTAGLSKAAAAKIAADANRVVATAEPNANGTFDVVVRVGDGIVTDHSFVKKTYKTEANALKAAAKAADEVEKSLAGGAGNTVQQSTAAANANDEMLRQAVKADEIDPVDQRIRADLAEGSKKNSLLNKLAQTIERPGLYRPVRELNEKQAAKFEKLKQTFLTRIDDFKDAELTTMQFSPAKIAKVTIQQLEKYVNTPAKSVKVNELFDEMLAANAVIPGNFRALRAALRANNASPDEAFIDDLLFIATDPGSSPQAVSQALQAFDLSKANLEQAAANTPTMKPWTDGIVTPEDAEDAIRSIVDLVYDGLDKGSAEYKAIVNALSNAFQGKLKSVAGGADKPLTADEVEEVFEAFLAGADISKAINDLGALDLTRITENTYNSIKELAGDLQEGKITLSEFAKRDLSEILGLPIDNVQAALIRATQDVDGMGRVLEPADEAVALQKGVINSADATTATGNIAGADAAQAAEGALDAAKVAADAVQAGDTAAPLPTGAISAEAAGELISMRERFAAEAMDALAAFGPEADTATRVKIVETIRDYMLPSIRSQIAELAAKRGLTVEQAIDEAIAGNLRVITEDPAAFTVGGALKLDELGSHGKIDMFNRIVDVRKGSVYKGKDALALARREAGYFYAIESLFRSMGIPVRSSESTAMALRRAGVKPGTKKAKSIVPQYSSVTWADIVRQMVSQGQEGLAWQLRKIRGKAGQEYKLGDFLPTSIENAWLTVKRYKESGATFEKGSENYDEILFVINNIEKRGGGFDLAPQAKLAALGGKNASEINKATEDLIDFLSDNYDALKAIDNEREALLIGANAQQIQAEVVQTFGRMIRFSSEYDGLKVAFKAGDLTEAELTDSFGSLLGRYNDLVERLSTGSFSDQKLAKSMAGMYKSMMLNANIVGPNGQRFSLKPLAQELDNTLATIRATEGAQQTARAAGKSAKEAERAGKNARRTQKNKNLEQEMQITSEQLAKADEAGTPPPVATEDAEMAIMETVSLNDAFAKQQTRWTRAGKAMNGNYGMGAAFKTILSSSAQSAIGYSHWFSLGLREIKRVSRGREDELNTAFKALQAYRKELSAAEELAEEVDIDTFLAAYSDVVDREFFDLLNESFDMLLGNKGVFGAAKSLNIMRTELNQSLQQFGLAGIRVADDANIEDFWLNYEPDLFPDRSPLEFLNLLNLSVHRAAARVEMASQFDYFVGKTPQQIAELGEDIKNYVKLDTDTGIGQLLGDTNKLVHKDDFERLKYVQDYLNYSTEFGDGAISRIVEMSDRITYVLKSTNTLLRPGHHVVSIVGEFAMNLLAGVRMSSYNNTARILNKFRPGQYENAGEPFKAYAELIATKGKRVKATEFDNVYWIRPDGKREVIPDEILYQLAERWGVLVHPGGSLEDFIVTGDAVMKGAYAKFHQGMNKISVFASHRDNFFRLTHFIDELQRTKGAKNIEEAALAAATAIREWHPTAGSLSAFEQKYARRLVYFYTWQRVALTKVIATVLEKPGIATIPSKIQYAFADANGFNPESFGDPWDPDGIYASWHTGQLWGPQFQGPAGEGDAWGIQPAIQPIDVVGQIFKPFTLQPGQSPIDSVAQGTNDLFGSNLNPVLKTLIESSAQSRLGEGGDLPSPPEYLINQIGFVNTLSKLTGIGQDPNPYETPQETSEKNSRLVLNLLFGQRVTDYSTPATQYKWTLDQQEAARRLAGQ